MIKDSDKIQLKQRIGHLSKGKQVALALLFCERMVPALNKFAKETGFDSSVYREHLDDAWRNPDQGTSSSDYGEAAKQCLDCSCSEGLCEAGGQSTTSRRNER